MGQAQAGALVPITEEQARAIELRHSSLLVAAQELVIDSLSAEETAWEIVNGIAELKKLIEGDFAPSKRGAYGAWKAVVAQEAGHLERLEQPNQIVRGKLSVWEGEKRRIQAEAQRKAREEAERVAAEERRVAQETAQAEAEERRLEEAVAAEAAGDTEKAEELLEAPVEAEPVPDPIPVVVPTFIAPKVEGAGAMVTVWKFEITDANAIPREYLLVDESKIGKVVQALKEQTNIPGVRVYSELEARRTRRRVGA